MNAAGHKPLEIVGRGLPRLDAEEKVRGQAQYAADLPVPGAWHGCLVRSPVPRGRLRRLVFDPSFDWDRVAVVTPDDIPGENIVDMMGRDMPFLAHDEVRYRGEPLALVAAPSLELAEQAAARIVPEIEPLPAILTMDEVVQAHKAAPDSLHVLWSQRIVKGDVEAAFADADEIVEAEYSCGHQEQLYIEPQGMVAIPEEDGGLFIQGSLQCPYYINPELCVTLDMPPEKLRVKQAVVGGAFGGKEDFPTLLAGYCSLLALKCGRPVKIFYDRCQDIRYTTKRHPAWTRFRTGLMRDGSIAAMQVELLLDGGAYTTLSPVVLFRGILHATLGYRCDHVLVEGQVIRTNTFPNGAFRGFGAPQAIFGLESHIDELAARCGKTPHAFRLKHCVREGDTTATGQVLHESLGSPAVLEEALESSDFATRLERCHRGAKGHRTWYGIGLSFFGHGAGFTGDGEAKIRAKVALELDFFEDGRPGVLVRASSTEMGQGTCTILPQIAAEGLGIGIDRVRFPLPDTRLVPDSGPTVASRTAMVVGSAVFSAATEMRERLREFHAGEPTPAFEEVAHAYIEEQGPLRVEGRFRLPSTIRWDQETFQGDAYPAYSWGCNIAEVEIDTTTLELHVRRVTACYDIGRVINPLLAKGQIEGGLVQALGYAVMEKMQIRDGLYDADRMQTYVVPTALDVPELDIQFVEFPYLPAWPGAKGVGEIPMDGLAPAIANAVEAATGIRIRKLPILPEDLFEALKKNGEQT